ncbi:MAG: hypothetical protein WBM80_07130 [Woeseiaceae bacterium]
MAFEQALLVARSQSIDFADLRRWAKAEGESEKFEEFKNALSKT